MASGHTATQKSSQRPKSRQKRSESTPKEKTFPSTKPCSHSGILHIPSDGVVDRWVSDVEDRSFLDFPSLQDVWSYDPSQNKLSDINRLSLYRSIRGNLDIFATLERLAELKQQGILSEEEFAAQKAELFRRIDAATGAHPSASRGAWCRVWTYRCTLSRRLRKATTAKPRVNRSRKGVASEAPWETASPSPHPL